DFPGDLDTGNEVSDVSGRNFFLGLLLQFQHPDFFRKIFAAGSHKFDSLVRTYRSVENAEIDFNSAKRVKNRVEDHRLERAVRIPFRGIDPVNYGIQNFLNTEAFLGAGMDNVFRLASDHIDDFLRYLFGHGVRKIDLIQNRDDFQVVLQGQVEV